MNWDKSLTIYKKNSENREFISSVWYLLQKESEEEIDSTNDVVIVRAYRFANDNLPPVNIEKMKSIRGYFPKDISSKERSIIDRLLQNSYNQIDVKSGYTLSGIYSYGGVLIFFIISILSVAVLSVMYAYASSYAFIPYLNIIFIIVFVALLCYSIIFAIKKSEIRNAGFIFISSVLIALFAIYLQWFVTLYIRFENWFQYKPNEIWTSINVLSLQSFWTIQGVKITGALSWSLCGIEAIIIFIPTIFAPTFLLMNSPYCEYCKRWFNGF